MRILFTTEGTYPFVMGGVSTWCDGLIQNMRAHEFHLLALTGPQAAPCVYTLPANVTRMDTVHLWAARGGTVFLTGAALGDSVTYGDEVVASFPLAAGEVRTLKVTGIK